MRVYALRAGTAVAAILMTTGMAHASGVVVPPASNYTAVGYNDASEIVGFPDSGSAAVSSSYALNNYPNPAYSFTEIASVKPTPEPILTVLDAGISIFPNNSSTGATASSDYYFTIDGPADLEVPVLVQARIISSFTADTATADWALSGSVEVGVGESTADGQIGLNICSFGSVCGLSQISANPAVLDRVVDFSSNGLTEVEMQAGIIEGSNPGDQYSGSLTVDPLFTIDPTFLAANPGYSLSFSAGVGDSLASGIPEPATWAMMLLGIGSAGLTMRSRRKWAPAAA